MAGHDQLTKDLLEVFFDDLLHLMVPGIVDHLDLGSIRFLRGQLFTDLPQGEKRRLDLVAEVKSADGEPEIVLAHVEPENTARSTMPHRLWRYVMQLRLRHNKPVISMVIYRKGGQGGVRREVLQDRIWGQELARFTYFTLGLSGSEAAEFLERPEPLAWALAAQMRAKAWTRARHKLECFRRIAQAAVNEAQQFLLANFVETYIQLEGEEVEEYAACLAEEENQEVAVMELTWAEKIEVKAMGKGMQQMLMHLLEKRFGELAEAVRARIESIESADELQRLAERVLVVESPEELGLD